jgi:Tfp pilus assembly protein PilF
MEPIMHLCLRICAVLAVGWVLQAHAAPFIPESDSQVLERLPFTASDPAIRVLRALNGRLKDEPGNLPLALRLARGYLELSRATSDPRYAGYAQAALAQWWALPRAPKEVLILRATLRQRAHQFDAALADLAIVLENDPRNAQARLIRATVLQVVGNYPGAREECLALRNLTQELVWTACLASVNGVTGHLRQSYDELRTTLDQFHDSQPQIRSWVLTSLAEMAARADMAGPAEAHFRDALAIDGTDAYLLGAYADFLLDHHRPREVLQLLRDHTRADPLLLRYALALQAEGSPELPAQVEQLRDRFEASHLRGDRVHLREEARYVLRLTNEPHAALKLARENWEVQKEPADIRILLEAAVAAHDDDKVTAARGWLKKNGLEDIQIDKIWSDAMQPN